MIYQIVDEANENNEKVKQKVVSWAANKLASGPSPMDIGEIGGYRCEEFDVDGVFNSIQWYSCGGWGHL